VVKKLKIYPQAPMNSNRCPDFTGQQDFVLVEEKEDRLARHPRKLLKDSEEGMLDEAAQELAPNLAPPKAPSSSAARML
jgi:hypothetical protein